MSEPSLEFLQSVPLFEGLPQRDLKAIAAGCKDRRFAAGETVAAEGEAGVGFFLIESGTARVERAGVQIATLGPRTHFGEVAVLGEVDRTATIVAETDLLCWGMLPWTFRPLVEENKVLAWRLLQLLARRAAGK